MPHQIFLSHDSRDRKKAQAVAQVLQRLTLGQIAVWHSSDDGPDGGIRPGQVWLDEIRNRIAGSRAVVVLLTPRSLSKPWLLFEAGFGAAQQNCAVVPICIGIDSAADVPFPLAMYQAFQLADYASLRRFVEKLLALHQIPFDEVMAKPVLQEAVAALTQPDDGHAEKPRVPLDVSLADAFDNLREYFDRRFAQVLSATSETSSPSSASSRYNIAVDLNLKAETSQLQHVEIGSDTSVQDVLDNIYFMLNGEVDARTYLEQWVLRDLGTTEHLIVREMQYRIPAMNVFRIGSKWAVIKLPRPYTLTDRLSYFPARPAQPR